MVKRFPTSSGALYFGPLPKVAVLKHLKSLHIDAIWNLAAELNLMVPYEKNYAPEVIFGNVPDYESPKNGDEFLSQLNRVISLLRAGKKVFVHCFGGHGRTGMSLAAIKVIMDKMPADKALSLAFDYTTGPESEEQDEYIEELDTLYNGAPKKLPKPKKKITYPEFGTMEQYMAYLSKKWDKNKTAPPITDKPDDLEKMKQFYERQEKSVQAPKDIEPKNKK